MGDAQTVNKRGSEVRNYLIDQGIDSDTVDLFLKYHRNHPEIWDNFERLALEVISKGKTKWSARAIFNVLRYEFEIKSTLGEDFKINDHYSPYYARVFHFKYPEYDGFFTVKPTTGLKSTIEKVGSNV